MRNFYILSSRKNFQNISKILSLYHPNKFGQTCFVQNLDSIKKDLPNFESEVLFVGDVIREPAFSDPFLLENFTDFYTSLFTRKKRMYFLVLMMKSK